jgi:predicted transposase/invertase (TIGR01784 family)
VLAGAPRIRQATILNPFLGKETEDDKLSILDIKAQDELGRYFNIEMQTSLVAGLAQRLTYYAGRLYVGQMSDGMAYRELCPAISICVLSKSMFPQLPQLHLDFRLRERSGLVFADELQIHLVELPKSRAAAHNIGEVSPLERWAFLLLYAHRIDADELRRLLPEPEFHDALGVLEMITRTPAARELYEARLKAKLDEEARLDYARTEGEQIGQVRGEQIGQVRGEQIGQIRLLEQLLGMSPTASEELAKLSLEQLVAQLADLQRILRERKG